MPAQSNTCENTPRHFTRLNKTLSALKKREVPKFLAPFMEMADSVAKASQHPRFKLGAVIISKRKCVSVGWNTTKTHPFQKKWNPNSSHLHAEMMALLDAMRHQWFDPTSATVVVSRLNKKGGNYCSYPCEYCWAALSHVGIRRIACYDENDQPTYIEI